MTGLDASAVGRRVTVRRVVGERAGRPLFSDVVGRLEALDGTRLVVRRRDGTTVAVDPGVVAATKVLPRVPAADVPDADLEAVAALGWRATKTATLGDWLLRCADGFTGRANSVLPLGDPGVPLAEALERVHAWYAECGLPARFQVPLPLCRRLDETLDRQGWTAYSEVRVLVADLDRLTSGTRTAAGPPLVVDPVPDDAWLAAYRYRGSELPSHARAVLERGDRLGFASVRGVDGSLLGVARGSVDHGWLGVTAVEVAPDARRRGLGGALLAGLAEWAAGLGAEACYLQVAVENDPALSLYLARGFVEHHRYHYRVEPGS